jgi:predicted NBD/HSP70 family sugar kinase
VHQKFIAGIDLGASNVRVVIANADGDIEARRSMPYPGGDPGRVLDSIGRTVDDLVRGVWTSARVSAIGMALPGMVDPERGTVASAANLPGWGDVDVGERLAVPRGVPFAAENDANAAAVGEQWLGAARQMRDFVFVALGTGIGSGVVIDGKLHHGAHLLAGEVAFFPMEAGHIVEPGWEHCLEGVAGGRAAASKARELLGDSASPDKLFEAANDGHPEASAWLRRVQQAIAMALADIAALLDPEAIIVGGGVAMAQGERFLAPIRDLVHGCTPVKTPVLLSELAEDAQVLGAVRLALNRLEAQAAVAS